MAIYAIDFDNTLAITRFPEIVAPNKKMVAFAKAVKAQGHQIILWTSRAGADLENAVEWCRLQGLVFDAVNEPLPEQIKRWGKKDLKKFAKLRDKQGRKVYTIVNHGNTGTIDEVPYIINSACAEIGGTKDAYCMAYGPLSNYEVAVFSDIETAKSTDYKFKSGQICYKGCVFMGGNVVARNGFIRVKNPAA